MNYFYFDIANGRIDEFNGEVAGPGPDFHQWEQSFGLEEIHYKTADGKVTEVICQAFSEPAARKATTEFLNALN